MKKRLVQTPDSNFEIIGKVHPERREGQHDRTFSLACHIWNDLGPHSFGRCEVRFHGEEEQLNERYHFSLSPCVKQTFCV